MNEEKTVTVRLEDQCTIADAVSGLMHDLDCGKRKYPDIAIDVFHQVVEEWALDEEVLGGACHPDHRRRLCRDSPILAKWLTRRRQQALARASGRWDSQRESTPVESESLTANGTDHYIYQEAEFVLEHISESVVSDTQQDQMGHFGIHRDWEDDLNPYTSTRRDEDVHDDGIGGINVNHATPDEALASLCTAMLDAQVEEDARRTRSDRWQESARSTLREFLEGLPR